MEMFLQVSNTPLANYFLSVLQSMLQLDPKDPASDVAWEILEKTAQKMTTISLEEGKKQLAFQNFKPAMQPTMLATNFDEIDGPIACDGRTVQSDSAPIFFDEDDRSSVDESDDASDGFSMSEDVVDSAVFTSTDSAPTAPTSAAPPPPPPPPGSGVTEPAKPKRKCVNVPEPSKKMKKLNWKPLDKTKLENE